MEGMGGMWKERQGSEVAMGQIIESRALDSFPEVNRKNFRRVLAGEWQ